jgi:hypothetical protein
MPASTRRNTHQRTEDSKCFDLSDKHIFPILGFGLKRCDHCYLFRLLSSSILFYDINKAFNVNLSFEMHNYNPHKYV